MCAPTNLSAEPCDAELSLTSCPECGSVAEIEWSTSVSSTSGPVELAKIRCILRHWFLMPLAA